jgi:hypothetical protein
VKLPAILKNPDVVGWIIWVLLTLVLTGPCIYLISEITYDDTTSTWTRIITGIFAAAITAGILSWLGNEIWFRMRRRQRAEKRKIARKEKRR